MQIVLCQNHAVDEKELAEEVETMVEEVLHVQLHVEVCTPDTDERAQEPVLDLSGMIDIDIDIEGTE